MKCEIENWHTGYEDYTFTIEPENPTEEAALEYIARRPRHNITVHNTRLGIFRLEGKDASRD